MSAVARLVALENRRPARYQLQKPSMQSLWGILVLEVATSPKGETRV
jgi:hypothetical protein